MKVYNRFEVADEGQVRIALDLETLRYTVWLGGRAWEQTAGSSPAILFADGTQVPLSNAGRITHEKYHSGLGDGILTRYENFRRNGKSADLTLETLVWYEKSSGDVIFELIPIRDNLKFASIRWPGCFSFAGFGPEAYTVMPVGQGILIPNDWPEEVGRLPFDGQLCSSGAYMPWFGQVEDRKGYLAICETPWDAGYYADHPAGGPYTHVGFYWLSSLGYLSYRRIVRYSSPVNRNEDYNGLCKAYRAYADSRGLLITLKEKTVRCLKLADLIGCSVIHRGTGMHVAETSVFFDEEHPERNDQVVPFAETEEIMQQYYAMGLEKAYLHLDGWGEPGYDSGHPDCLPPCLEAGGWEGLKDLEETVHACGYLSGQHDQYRDYFLNAETYQVEFACQNLDGSVPGMCRYAGGEQKFLCASQAPGYVRRNYIRLKASGVCPDAAYLDVFTCNPPDECANPHHRMTRRECLAYRGECFSLLLSMGILPSSEECADWAMRDLVFAHYGPYDFMLQAPGAPRRGIPVPLFNLVYHDCILLPWPMDRMLGGEDYMLYALLNGGMPYLDRDAPYPDSDGVYGCAAAGTLEERVGRCRIVSDLHEHVAEQEMVRHEFLDGNWKKQRTTFAGGISVTVNLQEGTYQIRKDMGC